MDGIRQAESENRREGGAIVKIISLGWGVQSFTLAAMAALGETEPVDAAIHADTAHEASGTYEFAQQWAPWLEERGVKVVTVQAPDAEPINRFGGCMVPAFIDGHGVFSRQCTDNWKRKPIRRWLQANRSGQSVEMWLGISLDEVPRMKPSDVQYITHRWPLIDRRMTRNDCVRWLERHGLPVPPKSACTFCPYHSKAAWHDMRAEGGPNWQEAIQVDEAIRKARPPYDLFVHPSRQPLALVDLSTPEDNGQMVLWDAECSGICGV